MQKKEPLDFTNLMPVKITLWSEQDQLAIRWQTPNPAQAPEWVKDLVIYELNPRGFTSPDGVGDGHGSGTWKSLSEKLSYIADLGVNGIWLCGFNKATDHFNIWSAYGSISPDQLDPVLGTEEDFREMINKAHELGIKIILEVVSHGVVNDSPLITEHPKWFKGESWGMTDFDYDDPEFSKWWIDVHVKYVLDYGIDGFRIDGPNGAQGWGYDGMKVMDVWDSITRKCEQHGHPILVFPENARYHFSQLDHWTEDDWKPLYSEIRDLASFSRKRIVSSTSKMELNPNGFQYVSYEISCHDNGANNSHSLTLNNGSRCRFGYYAIFGPHVPIFYSGEEFMFYSSIEEKNPAIPLRMLPAIYNKKVEGFDNWWLAAQLQWDLLDKEPHKSMFEDCKKILRIRKENNDILHNDRFKTFILGLKSKPVKPVPYSRYIPGKKAIIVVGNDDRDSSVDFNINIPLKKMELSGFEKYILTDLWNNGIRYLTENEIGILHIVVAPDYTPGGGVRIFKIEPMIS
jgi:hypothetical protein